MKISRSAIRAATVLAVSTLTPFALAADLVVVVSGVAVANGSVGCGLISSQAKLTLNIKVDQ